MSQELITVEAFRSWLEERREEVIPCGRVLVLWLSDLFGRPYEVDTYTYAPARYYSLEGFNECLGEGGDVVEDLPPWAVCFQQRLFSVGRECSGAHFLLVLEETLQYLSTIPMELEAQAFRSWAAARPDSPVGEAGLSDSCPLACWLSEWCGERFAVGVGLYGPVFYGLSFPMPEWAVRFVEMIDRRFGGEITGAQVCEVLDELGIQ